jgi:uncharacterized surface protein with fasciclin (FAS1) repeats
MKKIRILLLTVIAVLIVNFSQAQSNQKNIIENAGNSKDLTTLLAVIKASGLAETLQTRGPFTVFAPNNQAFGLLPRETLGNLLKIENKVKLTSVVSYHVVSGNLDSKELLRLINAGNGKAELNTVAGGKLWASLKGNRIILTDENGGSAGISIKDEYQSNGVIHVIDHVVLPKS